MAAFADFCWDSAMPIATIGAFFITAVFTIGINWARVGMAMALVEKINGKVDDHEGRIVRMESLEEARRQ